MPDLKIHNIGESFGSIVRTRLRIFSQRGRLRPCFVILRRAAAPIKPAVRFLMAVARLIRPQLRLTNFNICMIGAVLGMSAALIFFRHFIFNPGLPNYSDLTWPYSSHVFPMHYTWDEFNQAPVRINSMLAYLFFYQFSAEASIRLLYIFIFTMMGLSMFYTTFKLTSPRHPSARVPLIAAALATVFFVMVPIISNNIMHWFLLWFYAFLPLLLYLSYSAMKDIHSLNKSGFLKRSIILALVLFIMSISQAFPFYFPFLILAFCAGLSRPFWGYLKRSVLFLGCTLLLFFAFSAVWLIPFTPVYESSVHSRYMIDNLGFRTSLFEVVTISAHTSTHTADEVFQISGTVETLWRASIIALPVLAFASLLFRRSKLIIWLVVFSLAFMFLGKGPLDPWGDFYYWLSLDSPILSSQGAIFRWPHKWLIPLACCYSILIGFTISYFLGWLRDRVKWRKIGKGLFIISIAFFLAVPLGGGYPLLTGNLTGHLRPSGSAYGEIFTSFSDWVLTDESQHKMFYYPNRWWWGSPMPAQPSGGRLGPSIVLRGYVLIRDSAAKTTRMGELLSFWDSKYFVFDSRYRMDDQARENMLSALSQQEDLKLVNEFGKYTTREGKTYSALYVYENMAQPFQIEVSTHSVAAVGGIDLMQSLLSTDSYDFGQYPVVLLDQLAGSSDYLNEADTLVSSQYGLDLYMSLLEDRYMVKPFEWVDQDSETVWRKASTHGYQGGEWSLFMSNAGVENWQQDYGLGLAWTQAHKPLDMPFGVEQDGAYHIVMRYFQSSAGHSGIKVSLDDEEISHIATKGKTTEWVWKDLGTFNLQQGSHLLSIKSVRGFNAVNLLAVVPTEDLARYQAQVEESLADKRIIHVWEAESVLNRSDAKSLDLYAGNASCGEVLNMSPGSQAWRDVDILREGDYRLAVRLKGSVQVSIDEQDFTLTSNELDFVYLDPIHMEKGIHDLQMIPAGGKDCHLDVVWLYSTGENDETVEDIFADEQGAQVVDWEKINPTKYRVTVSSSGPFMLSFAETYYRLWEASANGRKYPSTAINSVVNGFWIEDQGELEITIEFKTQRMFYYGAIISALSIAGALAFILWNWWRKRRRKNVSHSASLISQVRRLSHLRKLILRRP